MIEQPPRDPWRVTWQFLTNDHVVAILLLGIAAGLAIVALLPQMRNSDQIAYSRWLSEVQARFGSATSTLQTLGLFTVTQSFVFRTLLALLAGSLLLRSIEHIERLQRNREMATPRGEWRVLPAVRLPGVLDDLRRRRFRVITASPLFQADRWPWAELFPLFAHGGALLILASLLVMHLWGWRTEGLIVQSGERVTVPGSQAWIALDADAASATHSPGIVVLFEERGPGFQAAAFTTEDRPLPLQQRANAEPATQLTLALTEEQYFAVPEANLIVRLTPQQGRPIEAHSPVLVEVYRSPTGQRMTQTVIEGDADLTVEDVTLRLNSVPYARLTATFNPGMWPTGAGLVLLLAGALGSAAWPARRFWLRESGDTVEGSGDLVQAMTGRREA